jgi:parallel beta-helix repeat protein
MDHESSGNLVTNNRVEDNDVDGIVVLRSNRTVVRSNLVRANRVGRSDPPSAARSFAKQRRIGAQAAVGDGARARASAVRTGGDGGMSTLRALHSA